MHSELIQNHNSRFFTFKWHPKSSYFHLGNLSINSIRWELRGARLIQTKELGLHASSVTFVSTSHPNSLKPDLEISYRKKREELERIMEENNRKIEEAQKKLAEERLAMVEQQRLMEEERQRMRKEHEKRVKEEQKKILGKNNSRPKLSFTLKPVT
ncbi:hypothetical protein WN48_01090 [Eufriesea mexicana]|nr:hypothetical protein WN48_01090 [Eufriesea mexicana]